jgi:tetratricopeptide (TPR) repeat protein
MPTPAARTHENYFDLGTYEWKVTTKSDYAQIWFNRGLIWCYGFNHEEAIACFENSNKASPTSMAYWGLAYALGPNYNKPWKIFDRDELENNVAKAHKAGQQAKRQAIADNATPLERDLIDALEHRYPDDDPSADYSRWDKRYAEAMQKVYEKYGHSLDVAALYADALMNLTPWSLWDVRTGRPRPTSRTVEIQNILETAMAQEGGLRHPGVLHLYIHLMEMSPTPEKARIAADALRMLCPDAGHLNHMSSHIDILCGDYRQAMASNLDAIRADNRYLSHAGALNFYSLYRSHDYHFRIYAAKFAGNYKAALDTVIELEASLSEDLLRIASPPMADWLEGFLSMRIHVLVRFGRWADILNITFPRDKQLYCVTTAMIHYGRGVALSALGRCTEAAEAKDLFEEAMHNVLISRTLFNNTCRDILAVGAMMLDGELEYRRGNYDVAFDSLRYAVALSDQLPYDEPWGWMQPPRHALGALLLEQGHVQEARGVFAADLGCDDTLPRALQHPNNVWALKGFHTCLVRLGKEEEARIVERSLDVAKAGADVKISTSCFCATKSVCHM